MVQAAILGAILLVLAAPSVRMPVYSTRAADGVSLAATPQTIEVETTETHARLVLTNGGPTVLTDVRLNAITNGSTQYGVAIQPSTPIATVPAGSSVSWSATLTAPANPQSATIWFGAEFKTGSDTLGTASTSIILTPASLAATVEVAGTGSDFADPPGRWLNVTVTNDSALPAMVTVAPQSSDVITFSPVSSSEQLGSGSARVFQFSLAPSQQIASGNHTVGFDVTLADGLSERRLVATHTIAVAELAATITTSGAEGDLTDRATRRLNITVSNDSTVAVSVHVEAMPDRLVTVTPVSDDPPTAIGPGSVAVFGFDVRAAESVIPGNHPILFQVVLSNGVTERRFASTHMVSIGVLGDAEVSALLGIPAFFLVPGALLIIIWQMLGGFFGRLSSRQLPAALSKEFWALVIGLSLLLAVVYPYLTQGLVAVGLLKEPRSYLVAYGTIDVFIVWAVAFALPGVLYVLGRAVLWFTRRGGLSPRDSALEVVKKLGNLDRGVNRTTYDYQGGLVLSLDEVAADPLWIGPSIVVEWAPDAAADLRERVRQELTAQGHCRPLYQALRLARDSKQATVKFTADSRLDAPMSVGADKLKRQGEQFLVTEFRA